MRKQTGWLVRDPKGRVVVSGRWMVYSTRGEAVWQAYRQAESQLMIDQWWPKARKAGYTVEKVEL